MPSTPLRALVVDDERPVLDELVWLLQRDDRIAEVHAATSGRGALETLSTVHIDVLFLDVAMPGLSGMDVAKVMSRFREPPLIVFVTAHDAHAVDAFELGAVDYLLKPIREERLAESVRRATGQVGRTPRASDDDVIPVELGGVTRFIHRGSVGYAEAQGDYVRLHTVDASSHLIRMPLSQLAESWAEAGFARIHRSLVVNLDHVRELRMQAGRCGVVVPIGDEEIELTVARRHTRELRQRVHRRAGA